MSQVAHRELSHDGEAGAGAPETKPEVSVISCGHPPPSAMCQDLEAVRCDYGQAAIRQHCLRLCHHVHNSLESVCCFVTDLHLYDLLRAEAVSGCGPKCIDAAPQEVAPHPHTETLTVYHSPLLRSQEVQD